MTVEDSAGRVWAANDAVCCPPRQRAQKALTGHNGQLTSATDPCR